MTELIDFLAALAVDPQKLGEFIHDPEAVITAADLSEDDKDTLRSGRVGHLHDAAALQSIAPMTAPVTVVTQPPPLTKPQSIASLSNRP